jgi:hypothetical protein
MAHYQRSLFIFASILLGNIIHCCNGQSNVTSTSTTPVAYITYFSDLNCTEVAAVQGFLPDEHYLPKTALWNTLGEEISCVDAMACYFFPDGPTCKALNVSLGEQADVYAEERDDGLYVCDNTNWALGQPDCHPVDLETCRKSSLYNCYILWTLADEFEENPDAFIPSLTAEENGSNATAGLENYAYLAYYNDNACTDLAAVQGFVAENPFAVTMAGVDGITCEEAMVCFVHPNSTACAVLLEEHGLEDEEATIDIQVREDGNVYECDTSNEAVDEDTCSVIDPMECKTSSIYNCNFRWMSAEVFAEDPARLIHPGNTTNAESPTNSPSSGGTHSMTLIKTMIAVAVLVCSSNFMGISVC